MLKLLVFVLKLAEIFKIPSTDFFQYFYQYLGVVAWRLILLGTGLFCICIFAGLISACWISAWVSTKRDIFENIAKDLDNRSVLVFLKKTLKSKELET